MTASLGPLVSPHAPPRPRAACRAPAVHQHFRCMLRVQVGRSAIKGTSQSGTIAERGGGLHVVRSSISTDGFTPFELEQWQSAYETTVEYNLADRGSPHLRSLCADWHDAAPENVLVTVGAAEANAITLATLVRPGDHVIVMEPGYRQVRGCAANLGAAVSAFPLDATRGWRPNLPALAAAVMPATRLIAVTNPNNPVGTILTEEEMDAIVAIASRAGAWLLADEVYRGTERLTNAVTPSFWGRYERVICVGSLSKAFGLPGLRLGWLAAPPDVVEQAWRRHEYATISASMLSMHLAEKALAAPMREALLARNRALIRAGYAQLERWAAASEGLLTLRPPQATALAFVEYHLDAPSLEVAHALRTQGSVLVGAGAHFGVERHLRITHGLKPPYLTAALGRILAVLRTLRKRDAVAAG